jgi:hypothetical protein
MENVLRVGDSVMWRGGFGSDAPKLAIVKNIEICSEGSKNGMKVSNCDWEKVKKGNVVVDLSNGHWCYGSQLDPIKEK